MKRIAKPLFLLALLALIPRLALAEGWQQQVPFWSSNLQAAGWSQLFHPNPTQALGQLPKGVQTMLKTEIQDNPWITGHEEMKAKLDKFRPEAQQVFDLPYIPIPASKMKFKYQDSAMSAEMKRDDRFNKGGQEMIRFFFHPLYAEKYKELIETYGARYGEYWATPTSSPRSLVVWHRTAIEPAGRDDRRTVALPSSPATI